MRTKLGPATVQEYCSLGHIDEHGPLMTGHRHNHRPRICGHCDSTTQCKTHEHMVYRCVAYPSTGSHIIPDDEDNGETRSSPYPLRSPYANRIFLGPVVPTKNLRGENRTDLITDEVLPPVNVIKPDEELLSSKTPQYELLCWHYRIDQLPFSRLRILFLLDIIPRKLLLCKDTKICRMPLRGYDQMAMALGRQSSQKSAPDNNTGRMCVSVSYRVPNTRLHHSAERGTDETLL